MKNKFLLSFAIMFAILTVSCTQNRQNSTAGNDTTTVDSVQKKLNAYATFKLTTDLSKLTPKEKQMLPLLFEAAKLMDAVYWKETFGNRDSLPAAIKTDAEKKFFALNYGPWDRLGDNKPFVAGIGEKPAGSGFYPKDMTKEEFEKFNNSEKTELYNIIRRDKSRQLVVIPYHKAFEPEITKAAELLKQAAELAEDAGLKKYLQLRSQALLSDNYFESDLAWMDMKTNTLDFVVGPIETYEDGLFNFKAAHEAFVLVKDKEWSGKLSKFAALLPKLQLRLPAAEKYKAEVPGSNSDLGAYDVLYYAGDANAGGKTIAINLPNDEKVQEKKGSRRLQLKNAMEAKFTNILKPISDVLIAEDQRKHIKFDAFFENVMFHETAHGLGIRYVVGTKNTVGSALKEHSTAIEEGKADVLGLFLVTQLFEMGELGQKDLMDNYVTYLAGIFRSVRFGIADSHGKSNMLQFYFFEEKGAFTRDAQTGTYRVNFNKMKSALNELGEKILVIQGDGNYEAAKKWIADNAKVGADLQKDLDRVNSAGIPVDIVFEQGLHVLGL